MDKLDISNKERKLIMEGHEIDAMIHGLTDVILNIERFVNENKHHTLNADLRDAMNLAASMLGTCVEFRGADNSCQS